MRDILFTIPLPWKDGGLPIHSYGVMAMLGFLAALFAARWRAKRVGISAENITDVSIAALIGGILGARVFYCVQYAHGFQSFWDYFKIWRGGLVVYGGVLGAALCVGLIIRMRKLRLLNVLDVAAYTFCLGLAFGRIGCFFHGCCYGVAVKPDAWYGVVFPPNAQPYLDGGACPLAPGTPLFPSQLLSSLNLLIIFVVTSLYFRHRRREGEILGLVFILYSIHRVCIELLRSDTHVPGQLSIAQWISVFTFFLGLALFIYARTSPQPEPAPAQVVKGPPPPPRKKNRRKKKKRA